MTDEPDGAYDWPHAVGAESKARQWRLARGIHDTEMRSGDKIDELLEAYLAQNDEVERLRGLLEAADAVIPDFQEIGKLLDLPLGESVHDKIVPSIRRLLKLLEAADFIIDYARLSLAGPYWDKRLAAYDSLKDDKLKGE